MNKRFSSILALVAAVMLVAAACGGADDAADTSAADQTAPPATVVDVATSSDQFSTLVAAVEASGLTETLQSEGPFTVFAPTDEAFAAAFDALGITAEELLADNETLTAILTYHVLPQEAGSAVVSELDGQTVATVNGAEVAISVVDGSVMVDEATVVTADIEAGNGVVHVIDQVILPADVSAAPGAGDDDAMDDATTEDSMEEAMSVVDVAVASGDFPTLVAALQAAGLDEVLAEGGPYTVFAPTEEAFASALDALNLTAEELLADTATLTSILTYHVVAADAPSSVVVALDGQEVETVNGATVTVSVDGDTVMVNDATVEAVDIAADNGVIRVIDSVLLPPSN